MPPFSKQLSEEGAAIMSLKLVSNGVFNEAEITRVLCTPPADGDPRCSPTRNLADNLSDLKAQVAANQKGITLVQEVSSPSPIIPIAAVQQNTSLLHIIVADSPVFSQSGSRLYVFHPRQCGTTGWGLLSSVPSVLQ